MKKRTTAFFVLAILLFVCGCQRKELSRLSDYMSEKTDAGITSSRIAVDDPEDDDVFGDDDEEYSHDKDFSEDVNKTVNAATKDIKPQETESKIDLIDYKLYVSQDDFKETEQEFLDYRGEDNFLFMKGTINSDTPYELEEIFDDNPDIEVIVMTFVGGSMDDDANLEASKFIRTKKLITYLPSSGLIASGGTDFFLAGEKRYIEEGAQVGVHSWEDDRGITAQDIPKDSPEHSKYLEYYKLMNISEDFYWFTIKAAPADDMRFMSREEMEKYGVATTIIQEGSEE